MIRALLLGTASLALAATVAAAADLPARRAPPVYVPPIPTFSWTGLYVGGQVGYGFGRDRAVINPEGLFGVVVPYGTSPSGVIGGGHVGYLFSTQSLPVFGNLLGGFGSGGVIGIEGDVDGLSGQRTVDAGALAGGLPNTFFTRIRSDIQGSARGRLGIAVDRLLFYATGGAAFADFRTNYDDSGFNGVNETFRHSRVGYTVGGGVEYAFTNNISARVEYRYSDFGSFVDSTTFSGAGVPFNVYHRETMQRVQAGISYRFAAPLAPVVARY